MKAGAASAVRGVLLGEATGYRSVALVTLPLIGPELLPAGV